MIFKLFRKQADSRPRFAPDTSLAEALQRRVNAIEFQPSRGFLKDQRQPKRTGTRPAWVADELRGVDGKYVRARRSPFLTGAI